MPLDIELIGVLITLNAPIYAALWKLLHDTTRNQDDIRQLKDVIAEFKRCRYCHKGIEPGGG